MLEWLKNYLLQQEMKSNSKIQKQFVEWERVQSVVVLVAGGKYSSIKDFVKQSGRTIDIIVVHSDKTSETKDCFLS